MALLLAVLALLASGIAGCREERPGRHGRWHERTPVRHASLDSEQQAMIEQLEAIGYVDGSRAPSSEEEGVVLYDRGSARPGFNFYTSGHEPSAILMDMEGRVLHRWHKTYWEIWPDDHEIDEDHDGTHSWRRAHLFPNGDVLAIFEGLALFKVDRDSHLIWAQRNGAHHDLEVMPDGRIYVLTREAHMVPRVDEDEPILEDFVAILAADGTELSRVSLLEAFENSDYPWRDWGPRSGDIFHTNTIEVLDGTLEHRNPAFRKGNVLVSMRDLDAIAVVDLAARKVVWALRGGFLQQHDPSSLANGHLLLFDNQGAGEASRVLELDPADGSVQWTYRGSAAEPFFSSTCGTAARLPGGNTLITESDGGRAFEVTPDGRIVWEFLSPHRAGSHDQFVATLYDVTRVPPDFLTGGPSTLAVAD